MSPIAMFLVMGTVYALCNLAFGFWLLTRKRPVRTATVGTVYVISVSGVGNG